MTVIEKTTTKPMEFVRNTSKSMHVFHSVTFVELSERLMPKLEGCSHALWKTFLVVVPTEFLKPPSIVTNGRLERYVNVFRTVTFASVSDLSTDRKLGPFTNLDAIHCHEMNMGVLNR